MRLVRLVRRSLALAPAALLVAGCVQVYGPPPETAAAGAAAKAANGPANGAKKDDKKGPLKPWKEVLEHSEPVGDGFLAFHLKRDRSLLLELRPEQLERDFGMTLHLSRGVGEFNLHAGLPYSGAQLMRFRRVGDRLLLIHRNPRFTADPGSGMEKALEVNTGHSIVASFPVVSENEESKNLLADVTPFFVSDYAWVAYSMKYAFGDKPVAFDKEKSFVERARAFPENVELDVTLTYAPSDVPPAAAVGGAAAAGVSDFRWVPVTMRYSLFALPEEPMRPRLADDRVGHFVTAVRDYSRDREKSTFVGYVERWRLEKRDHAAALAEPVQPIVYYVDWSVPEPYRRYVKEGIEGWNDAFQAAGFTRAIVAKDPPTDDPDWSPEDIRYSTIRWTAANRMGYAIGPSEVDPRSGEILNADILISWSFVAGWASLYESQIGPEAVVADLRRLEEGLAAMPWARGRLCAAEAGIGNQLALQHAVLAALGELPPDGRVPAAFLGDAIRVLVLHEVGHTLGLRHNFSSSIATPYDKLHDTAFTAEHGVTQSVMDYESVNIALDRAAQGHYFNQGVGSYDRWAIQYAYAPIYEQEEGGELAVAGALVATSEDERAGLAKIARRAGEPLHAYATDEDNWLGPWAVDPRANAWDVGSDPLAFARDRGRLVDATLPLLEERLIADGESYDRLRGAYARLLVERWLPLYLGVTKTVGGIYVSRDHKGDPAGRPPMRPVPAERQREALRLIVDGFLAEGAVPLHPQLLNKLLPTRLSHWGTGWGATPVDYPLHDVLLGYQGQLLDELLHPARLTRLLDNELRVPPGEEPYRMSELLDTLTASTWSEIEGGRPAAVGSLRRGLQRATIDRLARLALARKGNPLFPEPPQDARALARYELRKVAGWIDGALSGRERLDVATRAHLEESAARIRQVLEAPLALPPA
ncbi:MAG TPA: zinc-dependent metalloprotease [Thermoanaerobaculia bacterium]|nr:zinc-dependent metalloprotease [Thermoanaerobaculia bacterium]